MPRWTSLLLFASIFGCGDRAEAPPEWPWKPAKVKTSEEQPKHILVDHILIGVQSGAFPQGRRTAENAQMFARELFLELRDGGDWEAAKTTHSEDPPATDQPRGGPYGMANHGASPEGKEFPRARMVGAFGDVGFQLEVGEMGLAEYDPQTSKYGYHIIKRVK
jgi:hypothetical protein